MLLNEFRFIEVKAKNITGKKSHGLKNATRKNKIQEHFGTVSASFFDKHFCTPSITPG